MELACFENRELSWLRFNERVLEEAEDERVPLCERLTFLSIFQSNLDEFFMVRIGSLHDQMLLDKESRENKTHMTPGEQIDAALSRIRELCRRRDATYAAVLEKLREQGISIVNFRNISSESSSYLKEMFQREFMPLLSTYIVGKKQTFPFLRNKEIYAIAVLANRTEKKQKIGIVPCAGDVFPRLIEIPERKGCFILAEDLILHCLPSLFPGYRVVSKTLARITRNADIDADSIYDEDLNYRDHMAEVVRLRQKLCPVRLELSRQIGADIISRLCGLLKLDVQRVYEYDTPLDVSFLFRIEDTLRSHAELFYAPRHPQQTPDIVESRPVIDQVLEKDVLLHYPYQSIRPFLRMLSEAAHDPTVVSIRMTLYRLARDSKVVEALVEAAENGKQVDVLVELKARFDEENNIVWSRRLERAGCHVIYGVEKLKVHSKLCLITRKTEEGIQYITQIGTGNYNEKTSRLYTDLSLMTADRQIGEEAAQVFQALMLGETVDHMATLMVAPHCLQGKLIDLIDGEIHKARNGEAGHIRLKVNSLTDKTLMDKLIEASQAGVAIDMVVRGICCLRGGVPGLTDNIHIISIVGRFLEHSRIYIFGDGDDARCYIASADWMTRNTLRRVEVAVPILVPAIKERIEKIFDILWNDNVQARDQMPDGAYVRRFPGTKPALSSQNWLYDDAYRRAAERGQ
ncbi:MAG: polyphosphate kinase 1 [Christensenellaceae bacterium]|nr:polyphosphate kinase 1 [Christensenellaceae bacterium]